MTDRELITTVEAAKRLGVCRRTIWLAVKAGIYETEVIHKRRYLVWENGRLLRRGE